MGGYARRASACLMGAILLCSLLNGCGRSEPYFHNEAARTFYHFVRASNELMADGKDVQKAFDACFPIDLPMTEVEGILATGAKRLNGKEIEYRWQFNCKYDGH